MTRTPTDSFPAGPAQEAIRRFARTHAVPINDVGPVLGIDQRIVDSTMDRRWLPSHLADAVAVALRRHPCDLWPEWFPAPRAPVGRRPVSDRLDLACPIPTAKGQS